MKKALALLGVSVVVMLGAIAVPAYATTNDCKIVQKTTVEPFLHLASDGTTQTTGSATLVASGVRLQTPDVPSKVYAYISASVKMSLVSEFYFTNTRNAELGFEPSGQFGLDADGNGTWDGTFVWEAVYQPGYGSTALGVSTIYQMATGSSVWWVTKDLPGLPKNTIKTWDEFKTMFPDAKFQYYGLNVGSGNAGADFTVNNLVLKAGSYCQKNRWFPGPTPTATATPTAQPTVTSTVTPMATTNAPTASTTAAMVPVDDSGTLPVTGASTPIVIAALGIGLVMLGGGGMWFVWYTKRRKLESIL